MYWSQCSDVERIPGKVSGQWIVKGTRVPVDGLIDSANDHMPEEIATELFPGHGIQTCNSITMSSVLENALPHELRWSAQSLEYLPAFEISNFSRHAGATGTWCGRGNL